MIKTAGKWLWWVYLGYCLILGTLVFVLALFAILMRETTSLPNGLQIEKTKIFSPNKGYYLLDENGTRIVKDELEWIRCFNDDYMQVVTYADYDAIYSVKERTLVKKPFGDNPSAAYRAMAAASNLYPDDRCGCRGYTHGLKGSGLFFAPKSQERNTYDLQDPASRPTIRLKYCQTDGESEREP